MSYIYTGNSIIIHKDSKTHTVTIDHPKFEMIKDLVKKNDLDAAIKLIDISAQINRFGKGKVYVANGIVYYNDKSIHNVLTSRILQMLNEGFNIDPMLNFLDNLMQNPSKTSIDELYLFLESGKLPITEDGHFLAYKKVNTDFKDFYTGKFDHTPGVSVSMLRNEVDDKRDNTCSQGLHFCSLSYLGAYHSGEGKVIILKINPRDVVSIPSDYANTKGRACSYTVLEEYKGLETEHAWDKTVWVEPKLEKEPPAPEGFSENLDDLFNSLDELFFDEKVTDDENSYDENSYDENSYEDYYEEPAVKDQTPQFAKDLIGKEFKRGKKQYCVTSYEGRERDAKGRYTGDFMFGVELENSKFYTEDSFTFSSILKDKPVK